LARETLFNNEIIGYKTRNKESQSGEAFFVNVKSLSHLIIQLRDAVIITQAFAHRATSNGYVKRKTKQNKKKKKKQKKRECSFPSSNTACNKTQMQASAPIEQEVKPMKWSNQERRFSSVLLKDLKNEGEKKQGEKMRKLSGA